MDQGRAPSANHHEATEHQHHDRQCSATAGLDGLPCLRQGRLSLGACCGGRGLARIIGHALCLFTHLFRGCLCRIANRRPGCCRCSPCRGSRSALGRSAGWLVWRTRLRRGGRTSRVQAGHGLSQRDPQRQALPPSHASWSRQGAAGELQEFCIGQRTTTASIIADDVPVSCAQCSTSAASPNIRLSIQA